MEIKIKRPEDGSRATIMGVPLSNRFVQEADTQAAMIVSHFVPISVDLPLVKLTLPN
jgi:hypothetical protein